MNQEGKEVMRQIGKHCKILLVGFVKVLYGMATAELMALAIYGFAMIPSEEGYAAVSDFILATLTMMVALTCTYAFGRKKRKGGRY